MKKPQKKKLEVSFTPVMRIVISGMDFNLLSDFKSFLSAEAIYQISGIKHVGDTGRHEGFYNYKNAKKIKRWTKKHLAKVTAEKN